MGSRDMYCIARMAIRLSEREYEKLGSFGIDGYVAKVAKTERERRNQRANHWFERLVGAARCCLLLAEQRPKGERQLLGVG
jgi:hypothetical protein